MLLFFVLFVLLPALELYLLILVGTEIGAGRTFLVILVTGMLGAGLVRQQGLGVFRRIQAEAQAGRVPALELVEGLILVVAGALLVTPGLLTDGAGFVALVPGLRRRLAAALATRAVTLGQSNAFHVHFGAFETRSPPYGPKYGPTYGPKTDEAPANEPGPVVIDADAPPSDPKPR